MKTLHLTFALLLIIPSALSACDSGETTPSTPTGSDSGSAIAGEGATGDPAGAASGANDAADNGTVPSDGTPPSDGTSPSDGTAPSDAPPAAACSPAADIEGQGVTGILYTDENQSDVSDAAMGFEAGTDTPLAGETIKLLAWGGLEWTATTCENGDYAFSNLSDGVYLVEAPLSGRECRSRNCPRRLPGAVRAGAVKVVTMGDSVPVVGDSPTFPDRLAAMLGGLATIDNRNIAVGGTTSKNWLPGQSLCENTLLPEVSDADVLVISLGGNDILEYVNNIFNGGSGLGGDLVGGAMDLVVEIVDNVMSTVEAVREVNPTVDIVYCLYPNYGESSVSPWPLVTGFLGKDTMVELLETARNAIPYGSGLILADMYASFDGLPLGDYLYDMLHFNHAGATLYAETIFEALGGVYIGETALPPHGVTPVGAIQDFGITP